MLFVAFRFLFSSLFPSFLIVVFFLSALWKAHLRHTNIYPIATLCFAVTKIQALFRGYIFRKKLRSGLPSIVRPVCMHR